MIATDCELINLTLDGQTKWKTNNLGLDGVIIGKISSSEITGSGEWDPPGEWESFSVDRNTRFKKNGVKDLTKIAKILERIKESDSEYLKIVVPSMISKKLATYMLMREDLLFMKKNAELLIFTKNQSKRNEHLEESLWYSLISLYGRCFTDSSHSKKLN